MVARVAPPTQVLDIIRDVVVWVPVSMVPYCGYSGTSLTRFSFYSEPADGACIA
jgi:hypothetical protein